jgi:plastocyanin
MNPRTIVAMFAVALLALAAGLSTTSRQASADTDVADPIVVHAVDQAFSPSTVTVSAGASVTIKMVNDDTFDNEHDLEIKGVAKTNGTCIGPCELSVSFTAPTTPGEYTFFCIVHDSMNGTLVVQ